MNPAIGRERSSYGSLSRTREDLYVSYGVCTHKDVHPEVIPQVEAAEFADTVCAAQESGKGARHPWSGTPGNVPVPIISDCCTAPAHLAGSGLLIVPGAE
jgi:hypothetical protein